MFFVQTSTRPSTHAPKTYQTWKQNNQLPTKSHDEFKDNFSIQNKYTFQPVVAICTPFVHLRVTRTTIYSFVHPHGFIYLLLSLYSLIWDIFGILRQV